MVAASKLDSVSVRNQFVGMYNEGVPYSAICAKFGIAHDTAREWRKRLGLPPRAGFEPVSWMDARTIHGMTPREVVKRVAEPLGIFDREIPMILLRFEKLRERRLSGGRDHALLILAAVYEYVRWSGSDKQPVSPKRFLKICADAKLPIRKSTLMMFSRLFKEAGLFPSSHLLPQQLLDKRWPLLKKAHDLPDEVKKKAGDLISRANPEGRTPESTVAAAIYMAVAEQNLSYYVTQQALADEFGITEVSVRNAARALHAKRQDKPESPEETGGAMP